MANGLSASTGVIPELMKSLAVGASPWKFRARVVALSNTTLAGLYTIQTASLEENDRVLCVAQTDTRQNLLWVVKPGAWELALDADQSSEITAGLTVYVEQGTKAQSFWTLITTGAITLGSTLLSWKESIPASAATATVDPTPDTVVLRGPSGEAKATSFEMSQDGGLRANIGGDEVTVVTVNATKDIQLGNSVDANSVTTLAKTNGNISTLVTGTGTALIAAVGSASKISLSTSSVEVLHAEDGALTTPRLASANGTPASVGLFAAAHADSAILTVRNNADDGDIVVASHLADNLRIGFGSAGIGFLTNAGNSFLFTVDATEVVSLKATGIEFIGNASNSLITQAASSSPQNLTIRGAAATGAGVDGSHVLLEVGDAGSGTDDVGEIKFNLKLSNGVSGIWRMRVPGAAVGAEIALFQHTDSTSRSTWSHASTFRTSASAVELEVADDSGVVLGTTNAQNVSMFRITDFSGSDAGGGSGVAIWGAAAAAPTTTVADPVTWSDGNALKGRGTSDTVTTFVPADPHCDNCGSDFVVCHYENSPWGDELEICGVCLVKSLEGLGLDSSQFAKRTGCDPAKRDERIEHARRNKDAAQAARAVRAAAMRAERARPSPLRISR